MCAEFGKWGILLGASFIFSILLPTAQLLEHDVPTPYIVGGSSVSHGTFPWVVSITYFDVPFCGGTILNENYVLTAAHCLRYFSSGYKIIAGEHSLVTEDGDEQTREILEIKIHPGFDILNLQNDIGLIHVNESFKFNKFVQPATIANSSFVPESSGLIAIGWGLESERDTKVSDELLKVKILLLPTEWCKEKLQSLKGIEYNAGVFCAGGFNGKGTCFGDSGSPVHSGTTVYGVASAMSGVNNEAVKRTMNDVDGEVIIVRKFPYPQQHQEVVRIVQPPKAAQKDFVLCTGIICVFVLICVSLILVIQFAFTPSVFEITKT